MAARKKRSTGRKPTRRSDTGRSASPKPRPAGKKGRPARRSPAVKVTPAKGLAPSPDGLIRLNRFLADAGICSRRAADELIATGRIAIKGEVVVELGVRVDPMSTEVFFDGQPVRREKKVYVLYNKPKHVVCTNAAGDAGRRVIDFLPKLRGRVYAAGRLDAESEGLLLLTNDGDLAQAVTHPSHGITKTYAVVIKGRVDEDGLKKLRKGVWLSEGKTIGALIKVERRSRDRSYMKVTLREGRNREIRRIFARVGHSVLSLKRIRIGRLNLHGLSSGKYRFLRPDEVKDLRADAGRSSD